MRDVFYAWTFPKLAQELRRAQDRSRPADVRGIERKLQGAKAAIEAPEMLGSGSVVRMGCSGVAQANAGRMYAPFHLRQQLEDLGLSGWGVGLTIPEAERAAEASLERGGKLAVYSPEMANRGELQKGEAPKADHEHVMVYGGSLMGIVRYPKGTAWKKVLSAMRPVLEEHGVKRSELGIDGSITNDADDPETQSKLQSAFSGGSEFQRFKLYDFQGGVFKPIRPLPLKKGETSRVQLEARLREHAERYEKRQAEAAQAKARDFSEARAKAAAALDHLHQSGHLADLAQRDPAAYQATMSLALAAQEALSKGASYKGLPLPRIKTSVPLPPGTVVHGKVKIRTPEGDRWRGARKGLVQSNEAAVQGGRTGQPVTGSQAG